MLRFIIFPLLLSLTLNALEIIDRPIQFGAERIAGTKAYIAQHYGIKSDSIKIVPKIILIHATGIDDLEESMARFTSELLPGDRPDIINGGAVNVSAHFMVDFDGTVYRLMDETTMGRHVIGLNYNSIGIENVGGANGYGNLTEAQVKANLELIAYLTGKYPTITHLIGHHEYRCMENTPLWLELDKGYRTEKTDPGDAFMAPLRQRFGQLKKPVCE